MPLKILRGMALPWRALDSNLQAAQDLEVKDTDVFVISFPKSGTIWLRSIICRMLHRPEEHISLNMPIELSVCEGTSDEELLASPPVYSFVKSWSSPRVIMSHLLPYLLPTQLFQTKAKVVYIARNPKDVAVSYFHFFKALKAADKCPPWDEFISVFTEGEVPYGSCFKHVREYWEMRNRSNVLFIKYEDLKKNEKAVIRQVGNFLGQDLDEKRISEISQQCSIDSMRRIFEETPQAIENIIDTTITPFVRKGKVGNWKEFLTVAQSELFDELCEEYFAGTGLTFDYD